MKKHQQTTPVSTTSSLESDSFFSTVGFAVCLSALLLLSVLFVGSGQTRRRGEKSEERGMRRGREGNGTRGIGLLVFPERALCKSIDDFTIVVNMLDWMDGRP
jgi:hypothetical protein